MPVSFPNHGAKEPTFELRYVLKVHLCYIDFALGKIGEKGGVFKEQEQFNLGPYLGVL